MYSRRQAKLITFERILGFSFFISFRFQCNTCCQYAISCFAKTYRNNLASNFFTSCSLWYPFVKKLRRVPYLAFETNFFPKITTAKTRQIVNYVMHIQRLHKLQYHRRFLVLFSMLYPLFNKIQRNFNETVCERTRFAKI